MQPPRLPVRPGPSSNIARPPYVGPTPPFSYGPHVSRLPRLAERPVSPGPSRKQGQLFALAFFALLFGLSAGWSWTFFRVPLPAISFPLSTFVQGPLAQSQPADTFTSSTGETLVRSARATQDAHTLPATPLSTPLNRSAPVTPSQLDGHVDTGMRLNIPMLGVSLPVETVSVTRYGNLDMPLLHQWDGVGLYKEGTRPGYIGSAVIDGYLRRPDGSPAAFSNLGSLHVGDGIYILRTDGELLHFHVVNVESYAPDQTPTSELFNDTSGAYLNLIASVSSGLSGASYGESQIVVHAVLD